MYCSLSLAMVVSGGDDFRVSEEFSRGAKTYTSTRAVIMLHPNNKTFRGKTLVKDELHTNDFEFFLFIYSLYS